MINFSRIIFPLFCISGFSLLFSCTNQDPKPNILVIMTDQQPVSCVGAYGNSIIRTPHLDMLADSGHLFENFYIAAFPCSPSRASLLTGRFLHHHNVFTNNVRLDPRIPTLGSILSSKGYLTGYFGKAHLGGSMYVGRTGGDGIDYLHEAGGPLDPVGDDIGPYWHYNRVQSDSGWIPQSADGGPGEDEAQVGFEVWQGGWKNYKNWLLKNGQDSFAYWAGNHDDLQSAPEGTHMYSRLGEEYHMANFFTSETEKFIRSDKSGKPWAAVLSYFGPHLPVAPPKPWDTLYALNQAILPDNFEDDLSGKPARQSEISKSYFNSPWTDDQFKDYIRRYWGYCGYIDEQIGRIFNLLMTTGQWQNTLIIFTSDHGDMLAGHGMIFKLAANGYEELFNVPAIIKLPKAQEAGKRHQALTSSVDLLPTILQAANISIPDSMDGESLIPLIESDSKDWRNAVFSEVHLPSNEGKTIICRDHRYKYVYHWLSEDLDELYDLDRDPGELENLSYRQEYQSTVDSMQNLILHWVRHTQHPYAELIAKKASK